MAFRPGFILFCGCLIMAGSVVIGLTVDKGYLDYNELERQLGRVQDRNRDLERENLELKRLIRRLNADPAMIEWTARKQINMVRPGEIIVIDETQPKASEDRDGSSR